MLCFHHVSAGICIFKELFTFILLTTGCGRLVFLLSFNGPISAECDCEAGKKECEEIERMLFYL